MNISIGRRSILIFYPMRNHEDLHGTCIFSISIQLNSLFDFIRGNGERTTIDHISSSFHRRHTKGFFFFFIRRNKMVCTHETRESFTTFKTCNHSIRNGKKCKLSSSYISDFICFSGKSARSQIETHFQFQSL